MTTPRNRIKIRTLSDLVALSPPTWLIDEYLPNNSLVTIYGAPGCGKSFLALDLALSVATGEDWNDRPVDRGGSLYIACEAVAGMPKRVAAWFKHRGVASPDHSKIPFYFTTEFSELQTPTSTLHLLEACARDTPGMEFKVVVLDTLSRTLGDADENSAGEMNKALNNLEVIREKLGCAVIVLHHSAKHTQLERGSTVLRGACDTMLFLKNDGSSGGLRLDMNKQRDWEEAEPIPLYFRKIDDSAVLSTDKPSGGVGLSPKDMTYLTELESMYMGDPVSYSTWRDNCVASDTTFRRVVKILCERGLVVKAPGKRVAYVPTSALSR